MSVVETKKLDKVYDDSGILVHALNDINLQVEAGEFSAIVGPSGSGKTTLLNMIGGLDISSSGSVLVGGVNVSDLTSSQRIDFRLQNIGFIFQSYNLIPVMTVLENVEFIMLLQNKNKKARRKKAMELIEAVGLGNKAHRRPSKLSGGEQQRVTVARALASEPKFVLADEPTANLDSKSAGNLLDIMQRLNKELNVTFIFSTHDPRVIERARRVILLEDGKIVSDKIADADGHVDTSIVKH